ncbi:hypothetical protein Tco_1070033 [Tanacetum coccineum]|uniref:Uncharacterized protein n=1 Tax=Tanacetum coccineum TaxID=301880 RepID=A0ABQ5HLP7_9ASTR
MENANPSCSTSNREFLDPEKKKEIKSWLEDSRIVDSLDGSDEIEYFNTFPALEELEYHEWLLKYPKPSWVKAKIRTKNLNNIKISCKMGHFLKRQAYIDLESPINVMSRQHYNGIMNKGLESRQKSSNPSKNNNFVGRVGGLKVFVGNFTYECNFMILEDTTSIIDHHLGEVINMPRSIVGDTSRTKSSIPKVSEIPGIQITPVLLNSKTTPKKTVAFMRAES